MPTSAALIEIARRCGRTFLQTFVAVLTASGTGYVHVSVLATAATAGGAAVLALVQRLLDQDPLAAPTPSVFVPLQTPPAG